MEDGMVVHQNEVAVLPAVGEAEAGIVETVADVGYEGGGVGDAGELE